MFFCTYYKNIDIFNFPVNGDLKQRNIKTMTPLLKAAPRQKERSSR